MKITVSRLTPENIAKLGIDSWGVWESGVREFPWEYDDTEMCYFEDGHVVIETPDGSTVEIVAGDFAKFPRGTKCTWKVLQPVKKRYKFGE